MAAVLLTLAQAKSHLRVTSSDDDVDIQFKLDLAEGIIRRYLKSQNDAAWTPATAPENVLAAINIALTDLYENRGDDPTLSGVAWVAIQSLLVGLRDPALA
jgi:Phage gp6-like head-tail connector protein